VTYGNGWRGEKISLTWLKKRKTQIPSTMNGHPWKEVGGEKNGPTLRWLKQ